MSDASDVVVVEPEAAPKKKGQRPKKRPSDFEIARTILTRTTERKLPIWIRNMGEDSDVVLLCSADESEFLYGSSTLTLGLFEFHDPEVEAIMSGVLGKLFGSTPTHPVLVNLRDQMSELAKTKGESFDVEVKEAPYGVSWVERTDMRGKVQQVYYSKAVDSLFHFEMVKTWCEFYRPFLTSSDTGNLTVPYTHPQGDTYTILTIPAHEDGNHPLTKIYPNGFRLSVTRGIDLAITKAFEAHFPYPVQSEELVFFLKDGAVAQMVHRITGTGWRMLLVRPHSVIFPTHGHTLPDIGHNGL